MPNLNVITDIGVQKGPLGVGSGLLRGFWHPLGSRSASPTDGVWTVHRPLRTLPPGLLLTCGGFCKMVSLKCRRPFRPFEKPGPLWSPARSLPAGWGGLPKGLVRRRSIGISGRGLGYPSGLPGAHASRLTRLLQKGSLCARTPRSCL